MKLPSSVHLCKPMGYTVRGILQASTWVDSHSFSKGSSQLRDWTQVSCIANKFSTSWATREAQEYWSWIAYPFSSGSSNPRNQTRVSCIAGRFFTSWAGKEVLLCLKTATILTSGCHSSIYIHLLWGCIQIDSHTVHPLLGLAPHHQHHLWDSSVLCVATVQSSSLLFSVPFSGIWALEYNIEHRAISIWGLLWIVLLSYFQQAGQETT